MGDPAALSLMQTTQNLPQTVKNVNYRANRLCMGPPIVDEIGGPKCVLASHRIRLTGGFGGRTYTNRGYVSSESSDACDWLQLKINQLNAEFERYDT